MTYVRRHADLATAILQQDDAADILADAGYSGRRSPLSWVQVYFDEAKERAAGPRLVCVDGVTLEQLAGADPSPSPDDALYEIDQRTLIDRALIAALTPREERLIRLIFFHGATLEVAGRLCGDVTSERARQIELKALKRLRAWFRRDSGEKLEKGELAARARDALKRKRGATPPPRPAPLPAAPSVRRHWALGFGALVTIQNTDIDFSNAPGLVLKIGETWEMDARLAIQIIKNGHGTWTWATA